MLVQITNELNLNSTMCSACKGGCCKQQPGITHPSQWGKTPEEILKNLSDVFFVRPAVRGNNHMFHGAGRYAPCVFLADHGCTLKPHARPSQCLDLIPNVKNGKVNCTHVEGGSKEEYARTWRPYQKEILEAAKQAGFDPNDRETDYVPPFWQF